MDEKKNRRKRMKYRINEHISLMKRNSKLIYCKRGTCLGEKNHDKKYRHSPGREKPTDGEFSAVHRRKLHICGALYCLMT